MKKKKLPKTKISALSVSLHKPLLIIFLVVLLPFLLWGAQQVQLIISFGKSSFEKNRQVLNPQQTSSNCPVSSSQVYESIKPDTPPHRKIQNPEGNVELNLAMRGWTEVNERKELVGYGGDTDPNAPPSFGSLLAGHIPQIVKTYIVNDWDYANGKPIPGQSATPAWPVHLIGLDASAGEPLLGLAAGRKIYGDYTLMVLFATPTSIVFTHSTGDTAPPNDDGYPYYFMDICVDPNLLAEYQKDNAGGRDVLPAVRAGQIFGYAKDTDVKAAVRDTSSFMDPRSKKDWWQIGPGPGNPYTPPNLPTYQPSQTQPTMPTPSIQIISPSITSLPTQVVLPPTTKPQIPTQVQIPITLRPVFVTPTPIPSPTATPTPKPLVDLQKTVAAAKSVWSNILISILQLTKTILP